MSDCPKFEPLLAAQADGVLVGSEREMLAAHLESCPSCRQRLAEQRAVGTLLRTQAVPQVSDQEWVTQWERIARSLPARGAAARQRPAVHRLYWLPAAGAAAVVIGVVWWFSGPPSSVDSASAIVLAKAGEARIEELTVDDDSATGMIVLTGSDYAPVIWIADSPDKEVPS